MANRSADYLEVEDVEYNRTPRLHRSRSGGYADHVEDRVEWERNERDRAMREYYNSRYSLRQEDRSHLLPVRREYRPHESSNKSEAAPAYNVREVRPRAVSNAAEEPARSFELPIREHNQLQPQARQRTPTLKIPKVVLYQTDPPSSGKEKQGRSPKASPVSLSGRARLRYQHEKLQDKLGSVEEACSQYLNVEPADAMDLTFAKIAEQVKGISFELDVWSHLAGVEDKIETDSDAVSVASRTLERLTRRVEGLSEACRKAKPKDLRVEPLPQVSINEPFGDSDGPGQADKETSESLGLVIGSHLQGIELQVQMLKTLTRSLQDCTVGAQEEEDAVGSLVSEVGKYFGSEEAMKRYRLEMRFAGGKALEEARYAAATSS